MRGLSHAGQHSGLLLHVQMANASLPLAKRWPLFLSADDIRGLDGLATYMREESGYAEIQKTKPDTIGYALNDSPAGGSAAVGTSQ
jgi:hypothetical protein